MRTLKSPLCLMATDVLNQEMRVEYKGYIGHFTYDEDLEGQVTNITDVIHFHGKSIDSLRYAFQDAINEYTTWCKKMRSEPEKPSSLLEP